MTTSSRYVTTEEGGRQNMFAAEPQIEVIEGYNYWEDDFDEIVEDFKGGQSENDLN